MVKALHRAGIEVILDVVYNHTAEGNHLGPTLSFRGIDNAAYYRLDARRPAPLHGLHGHGQHAQPAHPSALRLIMDSLRYWVTEMHVDGFRFDLASSLAREPHDVDRLSAFFDVIHQDPVLSQVKLIAEPWDVGPRRLPGRATSRAVVGVERPLPRHRARLLARRRRTLADVRVALHRLSDLYEGDGGGPPRRSTSSPRTTASRCTTSSRTTRSTTRPTARTTTTARRQPLVELRRRGADRRSRGQRPARAAAAQLPGHAAALAGRADARSPATSSARTQRGNNNA